MIIVVRVIDVVISAVRPVACDVIGSRLRRCDAQQPDAQQPDVQQPDAQQLLQALGEAQQRLRGIGTAASARPSACVNSGMARMPKLMLGLINVTAYTLM